MNSIDYESQRAKTLERLPPTARSVAYSIAASVIMLISVIGVNTTGFTVVGFLFTALMFLSWAIALGAIGLAVGALSKSRGRQGCFALALGIAVIVVSIVLEIAFPGEGMGNIH